MEKLLLVEDDKSLGYILKEYLELNQFEVRWETDPEEALSSFLREDFSLCIFDIMMPRTDGFTLAEKIKKTNKDVPFIFLTARTLKIDRLKGFNLGADDYIVKPVDEELLIARINAIIKRSKPNRNSEEVAYKIGKFTFDPIKQELINERGTQYLTAKENSLLELLCENIGSVLKRDIALKQIWGEADYFSRRSMDVYISKLRKRLDADDLIEIKNVHGKGFILKVS